MSALEEVAADVEAVGAAPVAAAVDAEDGGGGGALSNRMRHSRLWCKAPATLWGEARPR